MKFYSKDEKIIFIKEISELEGGCIILNNPIVNKEYEVLYILARGIVKDKSINSNKNYDMNIYELPDHYINHIFVEIDGGRYTIECKITEVIKSIQIERDHVKLLNPIIKIGNLKYTINEIRYVKKLLTTQIHYNLHDVDLVEDIFFMPTEIVDYIQEQIKYDKYI